MANLGMTGGEMFAYRCTHGSNLDLADEVWDTDGNQLSLDRDIYPNYDLILCISTFSATAPLTAKCKAIRLPRSHDARTQRHHSQLRPRGGLSRGFGAMPNDCGSP